MPDTSQQSKGNALGIFSLIFGVFGIIAGTGLAIFLVFSIPAFILCVLGIIFYVLQNKKFPNGVNTAGLVTCIIGAVLNFIVMIVMIFVIGFFTAISV